MKTQILLLAFAVLAFEAAHAWGRSAGEVLKCPLGMEAQYVKTGAPPQCVYVKNSNE